MSALSAAAATWIGLWALAAPPSPVAVDEGARAAGYYRTDLPGAAPATAPRRIVSLAPVVTETLFALGAGDAVVGVTRYCDRPEAARALPKVGGYLDPQLEAILALEPDLVIAMPSRGQRRALDRLRERGVPVLVVYGDSIAEVRALVTAVGSATARTSDASTLVAELDAELEGVRRTSSAGALPRPRVVVAVGVRPLVGAGPGSFAAEAVAIAGGVLALDAGSPPWPVLSAEALAAARPDVVVAAEGPEAAEALARELAGLGAARPRIVHAERAILFRPGPHLADDVAALATLLRGPEETHPAQGARAP